MNMRHLRQIRPLVAVAIVLATLAWGSASSVAARGSAGAVYALTNSPAGNAVIVWQRAADGSLTSAGSYMTGGAGTGGGLGSQGAIILSQDHQWLFAVDAGSNQVAAFKVQPNGLTLTAHVPSGGTRPTSLTLHGNLLYVLNAGDSGNITALIVGNDGSLSPLAGSTRPLSGSAVGAAQVEFSPNGDLLVVTERFSNMIDTYLVGPDGRADGPQVHPSSGGTPFGFAFGKRGQLFVSEANGVAPGESAASSYAVGADGSLTIVSGTVPTHQAAACWLVVTNNGRFAYTANAASDSISGYSIDQDGSLRLLDDDGRTATTGDATGPTDMALSNNSHYLYVRNGRTGTIGAFAVLLDGSLQPVGGASGLPAGAAGLAAY
jgi:6-phosphogluconolactonase